MTTIDHTCIHVLDLDRSAAFYRDALGLTPVRSLDMPDRGWQLLFLGDGTTDFQLELCRETNRTEPYHLSVGEAAMSALSYAKLVGTYSLRLIMPQHTMEVLDQSSSIVGISVMASQAVERGFMDALAFIAAISMSLGCMNLLPIPPLDGGKILIEAIQVLIRRPLSQKAQMSLSYVGLAFFIFVFIVAVKNDVLRLVVG